MPNVRVLSFGAGVQSSALLLMCERKEVPPVDFAVFADPGAEPKEVYDWLEKIRAAVKIPIYVKSKGNIAHDVADHWAGKKKRCGQPPLYTLDSGGNRSMLRRHCTKEYKIEVVDRTIRQILGYQPRQRMRHHVDLLMGISADEMTRMKVSTQAWKTNHYPLVDMNLTRKDCIVYLSDFGNPPRSACYFCPFKSNAEWRHLRDKQPDDWKKACDFDQAIRKSPSPKLTSDFFVHRSRVPLAQADLGESDDGQLSLLDECDGMCGV